MAPPSSFMNNGYWRDVTPQNYVHSTEEATFPTKVRHVLSVVHQRQSNIAKGAFFISTELEDPFLDKTPTVFDRATQLGSSSQQETGLTLPSLPVKFLNNVDDDNTATPVNISIHKGKEANNIEKLGGDGGVVRDPHPTFLLSNPKPANDGKLLSLADSQLPEGSTSQLPSFLPPTSSKSTGIISSMKGRSRRRRTRQRKRDY
jgi:cyclophilin family peptidyl-prolyl cis-trans isomerase